MFRLCKRLDWIHKSVPLFVWFSMVLLFLGGMTAFGMLVVLYGEEEVVQLQVHVLSVRPHDSGAFTQGLLIQDGRMFESTGIRGRSSLREVNPMTGGVLRSINLDSTYFGEGLAVVGDRLFQLTYTSGKAFVYNRDNFEKIGEYTYSGQGWGLCYDGQRLIMSNGSSNLYFRSPEDFTLLSSMEVTLDGQPQTRLNELEYVNGYIYANIWLEDRIVKIHPESGKIVAEIDASGLLSPEEDQSGDILNGIAYDEVSKTFILTGKYWPKLFEVQFTPK